MLSLALDSLKLRRQRKRFTPHCIFSGSSSYMDPTDHEDIVWLHTQVRSSSAVRGIHKTSYLFALYPAHRTCQRPVQHLRARRVCDTTIARREARAPEQGGPTRAGQPVG